MKIERVFEKLWDWRNDIVMEDEVEKAIESYAREEMIDMLRILILNENIARASGKVNTRRTLEKRIENKLKELEELKGERK